MLNAKEALKMANEVVKEREAEKIKKQLEENAMQLESVLVLNPENYVDVSLTDILYELGCAFILHDGNVVVHLYDYEADNSFMHTVFTKVNELKNKLEQDAEKTILGAAKNGKTEVVYEGIGLMNDNEMSYIKNALYREDYNVSYNQEGDMVISW